MTKLLILISMLMTTSCVDAKSLNQLFKETQEQLNKQIQVKNETPTSGAKNSDRGNKTIKDFNKAKALMKKDPMFYTETLYCGCRIENKSKVDSQSCGYVPPKNKNGQVSSRATKIEHEHVMAAENVGRSFPEWREPEKYCGKGYTGRKCAGTNPEFARIEADLHNLWAEDGLVNMLRSNKTHQALTDSDYSFGKCDIKLTKNGFMARKEALGIVARTMKYMDWAYSGRGIISDKNKPLYDAWDKMYKATKLECDHHIAVMKAQGNPNPFTVEACKSAGLKYQ